MRTTLKQKTLLLASMTALGLAFAAPSQAAPAPLKAEMKRDITVARANDPQAFVAVRSIVAQAGHLDAKARGGKAPVALYLSRLGPKAVLPMIEMLADGTTLREATRRDVIEALGLLHDARALPQLASALDEAADEATTRAAAEAVARIGNEEAMARIEGALARSKSASRTNAILAGIGECRHLRIAKLLAGYVGKPAVDARGLARSLGRVGNAWAWKTLGDKTEEAQVRETAARSLVTIFVVGDAEIRAAASNALMVVDDAHTPALVAEAKSGASGELSAALDELAARFAQNPAR